MELIDQARDTDGRHVHRLLATYGAPEFVKAASRERLAGPPDLAANLFADHGKRLWPLHTAEATVLSALSLHSQKAAVAADRFRVVERRLDAAAKFHGVEPMVQQIKAVVAAKAAHSEAALPDSDFALVWQDDAGGPARRAYPLRNPDEVKAAAAYLKANHREFRYDDRRTIADKVLAKAAALGVALDPADDRWLGAVAGYGTCSSQDSAKLLYDRALLLKRAGRDIDLQQQLATVAVGLLENPDLAHKPETLRKVAALADRADHEHRLAGLLPAPEFTLFAVDPAEARALAADTFATAAGGVYSKRAAARLPVARLAEVMGDTFVAAATAGGAVVDPQKLAAAVDALPPAAARLFEAVAREAGVEPVHRLERAFSLPLDDLAALHAGS